jgi:enamine deaminase RidA (YjgF/YER057c/UK114 family)
MRADLRLLPANLRAAIVTAGPSAALDVAREVEVIEVVQVPGILPYEKYGFTNCVRHNGLLYLSGVSGLDAGGKVVGDDIETQTRQTFANIETILRAAGSGLDQILQMTSFVVDLERNGARYVATRAALLASPTYTSATIGISALMVPGLLLEVQCRAVAPSQSSVS